VAWLHCLDQFLGHYPHIVAGLEAVSTFGVVVVSLCLAFAARRANKPGLSILPNGFSGNIAKHEASEARYYLMRVTNPRRTIRPAHDVQFLFTRIEKSASHGPEILFDEIMPLLWVRQELYPNLMTRTVGPDAFAALFFVQDDGVLGLTPGIPPSGALATHFPRLHHAPVTLWVTLRAVSIEADSRPIRLKIEWYGPWHKGKSELENSCRVSLNECESLFDAVRLLSQHHAEPFIAAPVFFRDRRDFAEGTPRFLRLRRISDLPTAG
jgi:hypothetical protein